MAKPANKIGAHISIAGGIDKAPIRAHEQGCETFQCFTRPPQGGPAPKLAPGLVANFKTEMRRFGLDNFYIHTPYYINLASLTPRIAESSIRVLREELERGSILGAKYVMTHLGSHADQSLDAGLSRVISGIKKILTGYTGSTKFLIEISAGSGSVIGSKFEEIGKIIAGLKNGGFDKEASGFGGICFDTCHAFASGYDFLNPKNANLILKEFDQAIGLKYLKLTHVNDSKFELGMKRDRHEHIGEGFIGVKGLTSLLQTPEFLKIDWLLETEDDKRKNDLKILKNIRGLDI